MQFQKRQANVRVQLLKRCGSTSHASYFNFSTVDQSRHAIYQEHRSTDRANIIIIIAPGGVIHMLHYRTHFSHCAFPQCFSFNTQNVHVYAYTPSVQVKSALFVWRLAAWHHMGQCCWKFWSTTFNWKLKYDVWKVEVRLLKSPTLACLFWNSIRVKNICTTTFWLITEPRMDGTARPRRVPTTFQNAEGLENPSLELRRHQEVHDFDPRTRLETLAVCSLTKVKGHDFATPLVPSISVASTYGLRRIDEIQACVKVSQTPGLLTFNFLQ